MVVGSSLAWWHWGTLWLPGLWAVTVALLVCAIVWPRGYAPVFRTAETLVEGLLQVITWALLGLVYFGIFTPVRYYLRSRGHDPLHRQMERQTSSYWQKMPEPRADSFRSQH